MTKTMILKFGCVLLILLAQATIAQETMGLYFRVIAPETKTDGTSWEPDVDGGLPDIFVCFRATTRRWDCAPPCQDSRECAGKLNVVPVGKPLTIGVFDRDIQQNDPMYNLNIKDARRCTSGQGNPCRFAYGGRIAVTFSNSPVPFYGGAGDDTLGNCHGDFCCPEGEVLWVEKKWGYTYKYCQIPFDDEKGNCHAMTFRCCADCQFFVNEDKPLRVPELFVMGYKPVPSNNMRDAKRGDVIIWIKKNGDVIHSQPFLGNIIETERYEFWEQHPYRDPEKQDWSWDYYDKLKGGFEHPRLGWVEAFELWRPDPKLISSNEPIHVCDNPTIGPRPR